MDFKKQAIEKIEKELNEAKKTGNVRVIINDVAATLKNFANQDEEFAQAIVQNEKTLQNCCEHILKGVSSGISDIEAYKKAVDFYFPGAEVTVEMSINLCGSVEKEKPSIVIDITDFM